MTALRIAGRVLAMFLSNALLTLVAVNLIDAMPQQADFVRLLQGAATVPLMMLWFPSTRWKDKDTRP